MMKRVLAFAVLALLPMAASAQTISIDQFSENNGSVTSAGASVPFNFSGAAALSAIGGRRQGFVDQDGGTGNSSFDFPGATFEFNNDSGVDGNGALQYGFTTELNVDFSSVNAILIDRIFLDAVTGINFSINITADVDGTPDVATFNGNIPGGAFGLITVPFASFANIGSLDLTDVDRIEITFDTVLAATNLELDNIRAAVVPEPTTIALLGLAGASGVGYFRYRRRQKQMAESEAEVAAD